MTLSVLGSAAPENFSNGPFNVSFDLVTSISYDIDAPDPVEKTDAGKTYLEYVVTVTGTDDSKVEIKVQNWAEPKKASIGSDRAAIEASLKAVKGQNITTSERQIDGQQGVYGVAETGPGKMLYRGFYWLDRVSTAKGTVGQSNVDITSTFPEAATNSLLDSIHVEVKKIPTEFDEGGVYFAIPKGWSVSGVQQVNATQADGSSLIGTRVMMSDGVSAIRIDVLKMDQMDWLMEMYMDSPGDISDVLESYYRTQIIETTIPSGTRGSGLLVVAEGISDAAYWSATAGDLSEWDFAWTKTAYQGSFVGMHALFRGGYPTKNVKTSTRPLALPEPLASVLGSFTMTALGYSAPNLGALI